MNIVNKLNIIYPGILDNYNIDNNPPFIIQDDSDGKGAYIKEWNYHLPEPTKEELDALDDYIPPDET